VGPGGTPRATHGAHSVAATATEFDERAPISFEFLYVLVMDSTPSPNFTISL
jgi:hypothetical protein